MGNANEKLITGTTVYMIGKAATKVMQLLLLPIITGLLVTEEYGYYDLIISTLSLVLPIITLQLTESLFRFLFKADEIEKKKIVSTISLYIFISFILLAVLMFIINCFIDIVQYPVLIFFHYTTFMILRFYQKTSRSLQKNIAFAISGVLHTFILIVLELVFLLVLKMRVDGLFVAYIISNVICILYLENVIHAKDMFSLRYISFNTFKRLFKFSLPLIPNSISWWFVNSINTYLVTIFLGIGYNGIYSIARKFPQLLTFITSVFQMAWQESAIMEVNKKNRNIFYSNVLNVYIKILFGGMVVILPFIRIFMPYLVAESYMSGIYLVPILLAGAVFSSLSQFYGAGYYAFNKTKDALSTTIVAAIINCVCCIGLIPFIGLFAPALGTMFAYLIQWIYRIYQMRSYFKLHIKGRLLIFYIFLVSIYTILFYLTDNIFYQGGLLIIAIFIFLYSNKKLIRVILQKTVLRVIKHNN